MATTAQNIIDMIRSRTDMVNDNWVTDATLVTWINSSAGELDDLLVGTYEDYKVTPIVLTINGTGPIPNAVALPSDFLKPRGVDIFIDSIQPYSVRAFNFQERNRYANTLFRGPGGPYNVKYRIQDGYFFIEPISSAPGNYTLWYTPKFIGLINVSDTLPAYMDVQSWAEYITLDCCVKMRDGLDLDSSAFERKKEPLRQRILTMAKGRAQAEGRTMSRIRQEYDELYGWWGNVGGNY